MSAPSPVAGGPAASGRPSRGRGIGRNLLIAALVLVVLAAAALGLNYRRKQRAEGDAAAPGRNTQDPGSGQAARPEAETHDRVHLDAANVKRWALTLRTAAVTELKPTFEVPGRVAFSQELVAHIGTPLRGRAVQIHVKVGDHMAKGAPLLLVESPELAEAQSDYLQKRTMSENSGPRVELAKSVYERAKSLLDKSQLMTRSDVERREIDFREAEATQKNVRAALQAAENRLHVLGMTQEGVDAFAKSGEIAPRVTIRAPISGEVIDRPVTQGEIVSPERESLMVLADLSTLWVLADVPEQRLKDIAKGARALIKAGDREVAPIEGTTSNVAATVNLDTRTAEVRVEVRGAQGILKPGMFVRIEIEMQLAPQNREPVLAVPDEAIQTVAGRAVLFVPVDGEENTFAKRVVVVGEPVMGLVPVYSGLQAGERYVASGTFILKAELGKGAAEQGH